MKNEKIMKSRKQTKKIAKWIMTFTLTCCVIVATSVVAFAANNTGEEVWDTVVGKMEKYVVAMGGAIAAIGGVMWALGFKNEDSEAQARGIRTLIAGAAAAGVMIGVSGLIKFKGDKPAPENAYIPRTSITIMNGVEN